jgi:hypothetical protein
MRLLPLALCFLLPRLARADGPPLLLAEAQVSGGLALGGGSGGGATLRPAPVDVAVLAELTVAAEPWITVFGKVFYEGLGRAAVGLGGGFRLRPHGGPLRLGLGAVGTVSPYTIGGFSASIGACRPLRSMRLCADVEGVAFFLGSDLPDQRVAGQAMLVGSVGFDAL